MVLLAALLVAVAPATSTDAEFLTPAEVEVRIAQADPGAVAASPVQTTADGARVDPTVVASGDGFQARGTLVGSELPDAAGGPVTLSTDSGTLAVTPAATSSAAHDGVVASSGDAVVYANTSRDADTVIRPVAEGIESFVNVRSEGAPETYSWNVELTGDEILRATSDGGAEIVDPTPSIDTRAAPAPPEVEAGASGELEALMQKGVLDANVELPDADFEERAEDVAAQAGTDPDRARRLADDPNASAQLGGPPADLGVAGPLGSGPLGAPADADAADVDRKQAQAAIDEGVRRIDAAARDKAEDDLAQLEARKQARDDELERQHATEQDRRLAEPRVVAEVQPPTSVDADGDPVRTVLEVDGDTIRLHVDHRGENVAYPVAADPVINVIRYHLVWKCCLDYQALEYGLVRWDPRWDYVTHSYTYALRNWYGYPNASWGPSMGWWGWYNVFVGWSQWMTMSDAWWGPVYTIAFIPVYDWHWVWKQSPYLALERYDTQLTVSDCEIADTDQTCSDGDYTDMSAGGRAGAASLGGGRTVKLGTALSAIVASGLDVYTAAIPGLYSTYVSAFRNRFSSMTPENELKMSWIWRREGVYDFAAADALVCLARHSGKEVRGHALLWGTDVPGWIKAKGWSTEILRSKLKEYIQTVISHFEETISCPHLDNDPLSGQPVHNTIAEWDVVNEPSGQPGDTVDTFYRARDWLYQQLGRNYIIDAFRWADAASGKPLYLNEASADIVNEVSNRLLHIVNVVRNANPGYLDGVGFQMHEHYSNGDGAGGERTAGDYFENWSRFASLVNEIQVTEMDVQGPLRLITDPPMKTDADYVAQDRVWKRAANACHSISKCNKFTVWGVSDLVSWKDRVERYPQFACQPRQPAVAAPNGFDCGLLTHPLLLGHVNGRNWQKKTTYDAVRTRLGY